MNNTMLANVLREKADELQKLEALANNSLDVAELVRVLARLVEGKRLYRAFGAPGDWGYSNAIGKALAAPMDKNIAILVEQAAGVLYEEYCSQVGGKAFNGDPLPDWATFRADPSKLKQSDAWVAVAWKAKI
jgi:hypothetical protein